jgi:3-dehydroquinate dehydratase type II
MRRILLVHGPNLGLLGIREPDRYGTRTLADLEDMVRADAGTMGIEVETFQSNHEGDLIDRIHAARTEVDGIVINAGALTHYSYALYDALVAVDLPAVEVHISNIMEREPWRRVSVTGEACVYTIYGRGLAGYGDAVRALVRRTASPVETVRYGPLDDHLIDVRRPEGAGDGPAPLAVLVHGGFWRTPWTRDTLDGLAIDLAARGWVAASVEYRRGADGAWPVAADDVCRAIEAAADLPGVDAGRAALIGHSAGGFLALWAAGHGALTPRTVVSLGGVCDLRVAAELAIGNNAVVDFMGGTPEDRPAAYAAARPDIPSSVRQVFIHGDADDRVPIEVMNSYVASLPPDAEVEAPDLPGVDHFQPIDPAHASWQQTVQLLRR